MLMSQVLFSPSRNTFPRTNLKTMNSCNATKKVTHVQTQLAMDEVNIQVLDPMKYKATTKDTSAWETLVCNMGGRT